MDRSQWFREFDLKKSVVNILSGVWGISLEYYFYLVYVKNYELSKTEFLVTDYEDDNLKALQFTGNMFNSEIPLNPADVSDDQFYVEHWYKGYQFKYNGLEQLNEKNSIDKKQAALTIQKNKSTQAQFNKRPLTLSSRQTILEALTDIYFESNMHEPVYTVQILTRLHKFFWMYHPDSDSFMSKTTFILNSLVASGDLKLINTGSYAPEPKALATLEEYKIKAKQDEKDHRDKTWALFWSGLAVVFTCLSALGTLVQAGMLGPFKLL